MKPVPPRMSRFIGARPIVRAECARAASGVPASSAAAAEEVRRKSRRVGMTGGWRSGHGTTRSAQGPAVLPNPYTGQHWTHRRRVTAAVAPPVEPLHPPVPDPGNFRRPGEVQDCVIHLMPIMITRLVRVALLVSLPAISAGAQSMDHSAHAAPTAGSAATQSGQAAFAALSEVVRMLEKDPTTDWSKVDVEALRSHLIDMDEVVLRSVAARRDVRGGVEFDVVGTGRTVGPIRRMLMAHAAQLAALPEYEASAREIANGVRLRVTGSRPVDVTRLRALGFAGVLTIGDHHAAHHLMIARGEGVHR
jgi:hypothetical protein